MIAWCLIPARGGSKGIPKKNLRMLAGKPLILHAVDTALGLFPAERVILSTEDDEIAAVVGRRAVMHKRSEANAADNSTLDDVAVEVCRWLVDENGASPDDFLLTVQPTAPFLTVSTIKRCLAALPAVDSVLTVRDDRHLRWTYDSNGQPAPLFEKRVNRQWLPPALAETGGVIGARIGRILETGTRIGPSVEVVEVGTDEALDIDTYADWALAEHFASRLKVVVRTIGSRAYGMGHCYRTLALLQSLTGHDVLIACPKDGDYELGFDFLASHHFPMRAIESDEEMLSLIDDLKPDILVNDILDTVEEYVIAAKAAGCFVVNFEDLGSGCRVADVVVNDLYPDTFPSANHWYGIKFAILNPMFERPMPPRTTRPNVEEVLLAFGGTDPSNLTVKALSALAKSGYKGRVTCVLGPGFSHGSDLDAAIAAAPKSLCVEVLRSVRDMAGLMSQADLALTSAGRTVAELMSVGVPTIAICQNIREMCHSHATGAFGVVNLGLGEYLAEETLARHIELFLTNRALRDDMRRRMTQAVEGRSNKAIVDAILDAYRATVMAR